LTHSLYCVKPKDVSYYFIDIIMQTSVVDIAVYGSYIDITTASKFLC